MQISIIGDKCKQNGRGGATLWYIPTDTYIHTYIQCTYIHTYIHTFVHVHINYTFYICFITSTYIHIYTVHTFVHVHINYYTFYICFITVLMKPQAIDDK